MENCITFMITKEENGILTGLIIEHLSDEKFFFELTNERINRYYSFLIDTKTLDPFSLKGKACNFAKKLLCINKRVHVTKNDTSILFTPAEGCIFELISFESIGKKSIVIGDMKTGIASIATPDFGAILFKRNEGVFNSCENLEGKMFIKEGNGLLFDEVRTSDLAIKTTNAFSSLILANNCLAISFIMLDKNTPEESSITKDQLSVINEISMYIEKIRKLLNID